MYADVHVDTHQKIASITEHVADRLSEQIKEVIMGEWLKRTLALAKRRIEAFYIVF